MFFSCSLSLCIRSCVCKTIMLCQNEFTSKIKFRTTKYSAAVSSNVYSRVRCKNRFHFPVRQQTQWIFSRSLWDEVQVWSFRTTLRITTVGNFFKNNWTVKRKYLTSGIKAIRTSFCSYSIWKYVSQKKNTSQGYILGLLCAKIQIIQQSKI